MTITADEARMERIREAARRAAADAPPLPLETKIRIANILWPSRTYTPASPIDTEYMRQKRSLEAQLNKLRKAVSGVADRCQGCDVDRADHKYTEHGIHHLWTPMRGDQIARAVTVITERISAVEEELQDLERDNRTAEGCDQ